VAAAGLAVSAGAEKIAAQKTAEEILAVHPEITSLELAAARSEREGCKTVAATEAKEIGEKCDNDELTAIKTNRACVEQENDEFDVTLPIHDAAGKIIATAGMDFKATGQTKETITRRQSRSVRNWRNGSSRRISYSSPRDRDVSISPPGIGS
jgi:hypothetical protein